MAYIGKITAGGATYSVGSTLYGTCSTAAATGTKAVTCADFTTATSAIPTGLAIHIYFQYGNSASNSDLKLNINSKGAISVLPGGESSRLQIMWEPGSVITFVYNGTNWIISGDCCRGYVDVSSTTSNTYQCLLMAEYADDSYGYAHRSTLTFNPSISTLANTSANYTSHYSLLWGASLNTYGTTGDSTSRGDNLLMHGSYLTSSGNFQHIFGQYNAIDTSKSYIEYVGNGTASNALSNARTLDTDGNEWLAGSLTANGAVYTYTNDWTIDTSSTNGLSAYTLGGQAQFKGNDGTTLGMIRNYGNETGRVVTAMYAYNMQTDGTVAQNTLYLGVEKDGSPYYNVTDTIAFRQVLHGGFGWRKWMAASETQYISRFGIDHVHYGLAISSGRLATLYITGEDGSQTITVTNVTSSALTDWFTITLRASDGRLSVKNKTTAAHGITIVG